MLPASSALGNPRVRNSESADESIRGRLSTCTCGELLTKTEMPRRRTLKAPHTMKMSSTGGVSTVPPGRARSRGPAVWPIDEAKVKCPNLESYWPRLVVLATIACSPITDKR